VNKEKIKTSLWGAVGGAIMAMIIGFSWGGWVLGSSAQRTADEMVETALVERLTPICIEQFNQDPEKAMKIKVLKAKNSWERGKYIREQGWATMPYEKDPDYGVAEECTKQIMKIVQ